MIDLDLKGFEQELLSDKYGIKYMLLKHCRVDKKHEKLACEYASFTVLKVTKDTIKKGKKIKEVMRYQVEIVGSEKHCRDYVEIVAI